MTNATTPRALTTQDIEADVRVRQVSRDRDGTIVSYKPEAPQKPMIHWDGEGCERVDMADLVLLESEMAGRGNTPATLFGVVPFEADDALATLRSALAGDVMHVLEATEQIIVAAKVGDMDEVVRMAATLRNQALGV